MHWTAIWALSEAKKEGCFSPMPYDWFTSTIFHHIEEGLTLTLSANLLANSDEFWNLIIGHFFNDNRTDVRPWVVLFKAPELQLTP